MCKKILLSICVLLANIWLYADPHLPAGPAANAQNKWVDSVFNNLSDDERLGQLFMVAAYSDKGEEHIREIENLIKEFKVGGVVFLKGNPLAQVKLTNHYQSLTKVPLLIAMNAQNGLSISPDSSISFPRQLTLGAIDEDKSIYELGKQQSSQLKRLGVHMSFAPIVDVNTIETINSNSERTFGEDIKKVSAKSISYIKGLKDGKIIANARLFPFYEDYDNPNYTLPIMAQSSQRLKEVEMYPLREVIKDSVMGIMVGHASLKGYDKEKNHSATFSSEVIKDVFRKEFGFEGLIFTDALNMKVLNKAFKPGEIDLEALLAGNDVLIFSENISKALKKIRGAIKNKDLSQSEIDRSIKKILKAKYWAGLNYYTPTPIEGLYKDIHLQKNHLLNFNTYSKAITLVKNKGNLIPFRSLDTLTFASVSIGIDVNNEFQNILSNYAGFTNYTIFNKYSSDTVFNNILRKISAHKVVVVGLHSMSNTEGNAYGISPNTLTFLEKLKETTNVVVVAFGNPLSLKFLGENISFICAYEDNTFTRQLAPQLLFGAIKAEGVLPISISSTYKSGYGIKTEPIGRLKYSIPEAEGVDSNVLNTIDLIARNAVKSNSVPGCQVLIAKNGSVIFQKSYGFITYDSIQPVTNQTLYDIASITKVAATIQVLMFLEERGLIDLDKKLSDYLPELKNSNKRDIIIKDVLIHQAGLTPFIPHWTKTVGFRAIDKKYYNTEKTDKYPIEIAKGMYGISSLPDSVWKWTVQSDLLRKKRKLDPYEYKYSDVGYLFLKEIAEKILNQPIEDFLDQNFYAPLGASSLTYQPLRKFPEGKIAPTEDDKDFRKQLLRGYVHDQGAAMMGGIAGHAGLFSTANDLAKLFQMNLNNGLYGGHRYLMAPTLPKFTQRQRSNNRRGLGWDKPALTYDGQTSAYTSSKTYGHTGFTGTAVWVDPDKQLVYIFLSNRIYPNANNNILLKEGVRTKIQDEIYKAITSYNTANNLQ